MNKIYGYKEKDVVGLAQFLLGRDKGSLSSKFNEYAMLSGKAKGTVRNLYYALAKKSKEDKEFCNKILNGKQLNVGKIVEFSESEEKQLIEKIVYGKNQGRSVRSVIVELAGGDSKLALRYQNKFRNAVKRNPLLLGDGRQTVDARQNELICQAQIRTVKTEINRLFDTITLKLRKENEKLKDKIAFLELENAKILQKTPKDCYGESGISYLVRKGRQTLKS